MKQNADDKKRLVMSEPLLLAIELLDDNNDKIDLIKALVAFGQGESVAIDDMYPQVKRAFLYFIDAKRLESIYIVDYDCFR